MSLMGLSVNNVTHRYGERVALDAMCLDVEPRKIFGLLGPNGSGKSTLFRLISTLITLQEGDIQVFGSSIRDQRSSVRSKLGVVFQSPSLDGKLTVLENLNCQAALYGYFGKEGAKRVDEVMESMGLGERRSDRCEKLSGGLKRRVEIAKGMLHRPPLFLMDEPSTGLDPAARIDFWQCLEDLRTHHDATIVLTTHLLEEAEKCDRIAIMSEGKVVAEGEPEQLQRATGGDVLTVVSRQAERVAAYLRERYQLEPMILQNQVRVSAVDVGQWVAPTLEAMGECIDHISVGRPSLEDVFVAKTGHKFGVEK